MKITYLGTGAAERVPAIFCTCPICRNARQKGGREIRTQTQFIIDDALLVEFPGDSYHHLLEYGIDYSGFGNLLLSHWHSDHFYAEDLAYRMSGYSNGIHTVLHVYGSQAVKAFYDRAFQLEDRIDTSRLEYHVILPYKAFEVDRYTVYPMPARHGWHKGDCLVFAIRDGEDVFLSTHDSEYFSPEMFDYLETCDLTLSVVSLDCTCQMQKDRVNHMNWNDDVRFIEELQARDLVTDGTRYVANHFSHNGGMTYEEMRRTSAARGVITSYDGMVISTD